MRKMRERRDGAGWRRLVPEPSLVKPSAPLVDAGRKLIVLWSPKSACTTVYVWFSHLSGASDDVRAYNSWPHKHRIEVFYRSEAYRSAVMADTSDFRVLRIIRDPYQRAVSIFRHALQMRFADAEIDQFSAGEFGTASGISFQQFLDFVSSVDLTTANPHLRIQRHPFEDVRASGHVINISKTDLFDALNVFERCNAWPATDFAAISWLHGLEGRRRAPQHDVASGDCDHMPFRHLDVRRNGPFPAYERLLTPLARRKIETLYAEDFEAYAEFL